MTHLLLDMFGSILLLVLCATITSALLSQGDKCIVHKTYIPGLCIDVDKCEYARKILQRDQNPQVCGFAGKKPLTCCPKSVSQEKCFEYHNIWNRNPIIGLGMKAYSKEFPHMAAIGYGNNVTSLIWLCGGTLISHYFILTAAHCTHSSELGPAKYVRLGDLDLKNTTEDASPVDIAIAETFVHPQYKPPSHYHDIALFKLAREIFFGVYFSPACLHTESKLPVSTLQATGWGKLEWLGETSSHLMKVDLGVVDHKTCAQRYADISARKLKDGILDQFQLCAGDSIGKDTCPGDSGGPLHYRQNYTDWVREYFVVAGVTSFGKGCGGENSVGVYTRVSGYVDWIEKIVWPEKIAVF